MATESGTNFYLKVGDGAVSEAFTAVAGEQETEITFAGEMADLTDKAGAGWEDKERVTRRATVTSSGVAKWPDTAGVRRLQTVFFSDTPQTNCEVIEQSSGAKYSALFLVSEFAISGGAKDVTRYSVTLESKNTVTYA